MSSRKRGSRTRFRVGRVSVYVHHGAWWVYYRDAGRQVRRKIGSTRGEAEQFAAQVTGLLAVGAPTPFSFSPISVSQLRQEFLNYHEHVLHSSVSTVRRYRAATRHLEQFAQALPSSLAHEVRPEKFAAYLRVVETAPNGHTNARKRRLRTKGVRFILEVCRGMFGFAGKRRHLPPYVGNPFSDLPIDKLKVDDAKPVYVFDADTEFAFLRAADDWSFPIHFTLAKTALRVGELTHLLIEDLNLADGWLHIRNKPGVGWRVKTGQERLVPLLPEVVAVLRRVICGRTRGPVFLRPNFGRESKPLIAVDLQAMERICQGRQQSAGGALSRSAVLQMANAVWHDAGAVKADAIRSSFVRIASTVGLDATCPKSWRHTFATLMQDANVDPVVRQVTLGHRPTDGGVLGMTARYTHTRAETQRRQVEDALRQWPESLELARAWAEGGLS
jgi:integrase